MSLQKLEDIMQGNVHRNPIICSSQEETLHEIKDK